jgi:hypothetical protein
MDMFNQTQSDEETELETKEETDWETLLPKATSCPISSPVHTKSGNDSPARRHFKSEHPLAVLNEVLYL